MLLPTSELQNSAGLDSFDFKMGVFEVEWYGFVNHWQSLPHLVSLSARNLHQYGENGSITYNTCSSETDTSVLG